MRVRRVRWTVNSRGHPEFKIPTCAFSTSTTPILPLNGSIVKKLAYSEDDGKMDKRTGRGLPWSPSLACRTTSVSPCTGQWWISYMHACDASRRVHIIPVGILEIDINILGATGSQTKNWKKRRVVQRPCLLDVINKVGCSIGIIIWLLWRLCIHI